MDQPILYTKLHAPRPDADAIVRQRLIDQIESGVRRGHKLTLVSAPAGYGKSTLIGQWRDQTGFQVAWLSLDDDDNEPARFAAYVAEALGLAGIDVGRPPEDIGWAGLFTHESPAIPLLNRLAELPHGFALVLDDYHVIHTQPIHAAIAYWLERGPPQMHLVLVSRSDPPIPLARLRARRLMTELRVDDLLFTPDEATQALQQMAGLTLSSEQMAALIEGTEGWISGLQIAAISLRRSSAGATERILRTVATGQRHIADYLREEVFEHESEQVQAFLLHTSILTRFNVELCDALNQWQASRQILDHLAENDLFLVPLGGPGDWYRYHQLFAAFLETQAGQLLTPDTRAALHRRASEWYERNGYPDDAIDHALKAQDWPAAVRLLKRPVTFSRLLDRRSLWRKWLDAVPTANVEGDAELCVRQAVVLLGDDELAESEEWLRRAESLYEAAGDDQGLGVMYAIWALVKNAAGDMPAEIAVAEAALARLGPAETVERHLASLSLAMALADLGHAGRAYQALLEVQPVERSGDLFELMFGNWLGKVQAMLGQLREARESYRWALDVKGYSAARELPATLWGHTANLLYELDELQEAGTWWAQAFSTSDQPFRRDVYAELHAAYARFLWAQGHREQAFAVLDQAVQAAYRFGDRPGMEQIEAQRITFWLAQGDLARARAWFAQHPLPEDETPDVGYRYAHHARYLAQVRTWMAEGRSEDRAAARRWLEAMSGRAADDQRLGDWITINLLLAQLDAQEQPPADFRVRLKEVLAAANAAGYVRIILDEGEPLAALMRQVSRYDPEVRSVVVASGPSLPKSQPLIEPLSDRELEILALIAQGYTNQQIADRLFLALDTVKWHNKSMFGKLQVRNRARAVLRAQELGLLGRDPP
jgi:LuxR family maltose regulon positive regulatory protein